MSQQIILQTDISNRRSHQLNKKFESIVNKQFLCQKKSAEFTNLDIAKITSTDLSLSSISMDQQHLLKINPQSKSTKKVEIFYPKQQKSVRSTNSENSSNYGSIYLKDGLFPHNIINTEQNLDNTFRGLTYNTIKPQKQANNSVVETIMNIYNTIFTPQQETLTCGCEIRNRQGMNHFSRTCDRGLRWFNIKENNANELRTTYKRISQIIPEQKFGKQIDLDLNRTMPLIFKSGTDKIKDLREVLRTYSVAEPQIGYTQGMNYFASCLVYHCDAWVAFYVMSYIFEQLQMKDIYSSNLPGFSKHIQIIDMLILRKMPDLYSHFVSCNISFKCQNNIKVEMFCSSWLFSIFGMMVPIQHMGNLVDKILIGGWGFIYKFILAYLLYYQDQLLEEDMSGIMTILSSQNYKIKSEHIDWMEIIEAAQNISLNQKFIKEMHAKYNQENQRFTI